MNSAETTLTFDNTDGLLAIDTPEVHITRRVYRSGEGEYLINRQPCRLRDIRDLFAGTGLGTEAYSVIEQGKVDVLLQSSPTRSPADLRRGRRHQPLQGQEDRSPAPAGTRRAEPAAAVGHRRRSRKPPARRPHAGRQGPALQGILRPPAGAAHAGRPGRLARLSGAAGTSSRTSWRPLATRTRRSARPGRVARSAGLLELETADRRRRTTPSAPARIASRKSRADRRAASRPSSTNARRLRDLGGRNRPLPPAAGLDERPRRRLRSSSWRDRRQPSSRPKTSIARLPAGWPKKNATLTELTAQLDELRAENEQPPRRALRTDAGRLGAGQSNQRPGVEGRLDRRRPRERGTQRLAELASARRAAHGRARAAPRGRQPSWRQACRRRSNPRSTLCRPRWPNTAARPPQAHQQLGQFRERHSGAAERAAVLEELRETARRAQRRRQAVLAKLDRPTAGPLTQVRGLVADLLHVSVESAPLVEVALGEVAQSGRGRRPRVARLLGGDVPVLAGRVGFVWLDAPAAAKTHLRRRSTCTATPACWAGPTGSSRAMPEFRPGPPAAGRTWIVETLSHAPGLAEAAGRGLELRHAGRRAAGRRRHADRRPAAHVDRPDLAAQRAARAQPPDRRNGHADRVAGRAAASGSTPRSPRKSSRCSSWPASIAT